MQTSRGRGGFSDSTRGVMVVVVVLMMEVGGVHTTESRCCR